MIPPPCPYPYLPYVRLHCTMPCYGTFRVCVLECPPLGRPSLIKLVLVNTYCILTTPLLTRCYMHARVHDMTTTCTAHAHACHAHARAHAHVHVHVHDNYMHMHMHMSCTCACISNVHVVVMHARGQRDMRMHMHLHNSSGGNLRTLDFNAATETHAWPRPSGTSACDRELQTAHHDPGSATRQRRRRPRPRWRGALPFRSMTRSLRAAPCQLASSTRC